MGFTQANIWKYGIFKNIASMFSSPARAIDCVIVSETSIVSKEKMKLATGYLTKDTPDYKGSWLVIQKLMLPMEGSDTMVLPISERSYIPLDPLGRLTEEDKKKLVPLKDIAHARYKTAFARVTQENKRSANGELLKTMLYLGGIIACISVLVAFLRGCAS